MSIDTKTNIQINWCVDDNDVKLKLGSYFSQCFDKDLLRQDLNVEISDEGYDYLWNYYFIDLKNNCSILKKIDDYLDYFFTSIWGWIRCMELFYNGEIKGIAYNIWKFENFLDDLKFSQISWYKRCVLREVNDDDWLIWGDIFDNQFLLLDEILRTHILLFYKFVKRTPIDKLSGYCKKQLYNPHIKIGQKFALKQIEWAFE
tara:strand:+ start:23189 stop:23794 length:606 start_codon:yes stop_codon:yes gene_type:complete